VIDNLYLIPKNRSSPDRRVRPGARVRGQRSGPLRERLRLRIPQYISLAGANTGHQPDQSPTWWAHPQLGQRRRRREADVVEGRLRFLQGPPLHLARRREREPVLIRRRRQQHLLGARRRRTHPAFRAGWVVTQLWQDQYGRSFETLPSTAFVSPYDGKFPRYPDRPPDAVVGEYPECRPVAPASYVLLGHFIYFGADGVYGLIGATDAIDDDVQRHGRGTGLRYSAAEGDQPLRLRDRRRHEDAVVARRLGLPRPALDRGAQRQESRTTFWARRSAT
jgi:hypothetical protein